MVLVIQMNFELILIRIVTSFVGLTVAPQGRATKIVVAPGVLFFFVACVHTKEYARTVSPKVESGNVGHVYFRSTEYLIL